MSAESLDIARAVVTRGDISDESDLSPLDTDLLSLGSLRSHWRPDVEPSLALLTGRERFSSRDDRTLLRWSFVTWLRDEERQYALETIGVTGTSGRRRSAWLRALSASGWCRVRLEEQSGRLSVVQVLPVSPLSHARIMSYAAGSMDAAGVWDPETASDDEALR